MKRKIQHLNNLVKIRTYVCKEPQLVFYQMKIKNICNIINALYGQLNIEISEL